MMPKKASLGVKDGAEKVLFVDRGRNESYLASYHI